MATKTAKKTTSRKTTSSTTTKTDKTNEKGGHHLPEYPRTAEGKPPVVGEEGGVIKEGTGDFAPGQEETTKQPASVESIEVETAYGETVEAEVGLDGKNPVSPQNPSRKAALGGGKKATE